jgi:hypothetical protein
VLAGTRVEQQVVDPGLDRGRSSPVVERDAEQDAVGSDEFVDQLRRARYGCALFESALALRHLAGLEVDLGQVRERVASEVADTHRAEGVGSRPRCLKRVGDGPGERAVLPDAGVDPEQVGHDGCLSERFE